MNNTEQPVRSITPFGDITWHLHGRFHRIEGPAVERNGTQYWYLHGKLHRDGGPAAIYIDGNKRWYRHNRLHREDGPAIEYANGEKRWYLHGKYIDCSTQEQFERLMNLRAFW
jgi:hypothetical protein